MTLNDELPTAAERGAGTDGSSPSNDPFLAVLVQTVNEHPGWEIGVTLHVNGVIISGLMCSMPSFFEELAEMLRETGSADSAESRNEFAKIFDWLSEDSRVGPRDDQTEDDDMDQTESAASDLPAFIHLRAATVHAPGTDAVLPETLWRGRLDHVSGWSIGNFGPKPPPHSAAAVG
jgi:hypothetical protein